MGFNSVGQYSANHKVWDHVGNMIPDIEMSEGNRPAINFKVARWIPVQFFDKYQENWMVLMPGKGVALDNDGCVCPAGCGVSGATITYTASDVTAGTIDITTGLAVTAGKTVTLSDVDGSPGFMGRSGVALSVSKFVGFAPYAYLQWAGNGGEFDDGVNPLGLNQYNYNMQHGVAINCDYLIELPLVPAKTSTEAMTFGAPSAGVSTGTALSDLPLAKNTMRTALVFADGGSGHSALFVNEVDTAAEVIGSGDFHVDLTTGVITVYSGSVTPTGVTLTYYNYASAPAGSNVSRFACALGDLKPGDFLKYNVDSNYIKADPSTDGFDSICGQVLAFETFPRGALDKVKTAFASPIGTSASGSLPGYAGQMDQMPGTATGGVSDKIHYAGAADKVVQINIISR
jgi:hypothetical protein